VIDFSEVGNIQEHHVNGEHCVQFFPNEYSTVKEMLAVLDASIAELNDDSTIVRERGILLQSNLSEKKGYPIPCVILKRRKKNE